METTQPDNLHVDETAVKNALLEYVTNQEATRLMGERITSVAAQLGMDKLTKAGPYVTARGGNQDDLVPFTAFKKYARKLKNSPWHNIYELHTAKYWEQERENINQLAKENALETIAKAQMPSEESKDASVHIDANVTPVVQ